MLIFVYGTLRRGGGLSFKVADIGRYLGTFKTSPRYSLYDMGIPCLAAGGNTSVVGEVFEIEDLGEISHIHNMEVRAGYTLEQVELLDFDRYAYAYFQTPDIRWRALPIASGDWIKYKEQIDGPQRYNPQPRAVDSHL